METLEYLKIRSKALKGSDEPEDLLQTCVDDAQRFICEYCGLTEVPEELSGMEKALALRAYNLLGVEGLSSNSEGGSSLSVAKLSPQEVARLNRFREVMVGW